jgi:acetoin utilization deacetylase AcuC-like enzyme
VSAGFDAHVNDPLGGMRVSSAAFGAMTAELRAVAEECCRGRLVLVTEGGYDLEGLGTSLDAAIDVLHAAPAAAVWPSSGIASRRGQIAISTVKEHLTAYWSL